MEKYKTKTDSKEETTQHTNVSLTLKKNWKDKELETGNKIKRIDKKKP